MSFNEPKKKFKTSYELVMTNDYKAQVDILSNNETEKKTYLKHFLEGNGGERDVYFVDSISKVMYNKTQIVTCKEVSEVENE